MLHHAQQARIGSEQVLAEVGSALHKKFLVLAVGDFAQAPHQQAITVVCDKAVPIAAPDNFDYVPAGAAENCFKLLNNFSVTADRAIKALQVAVDDPDQIVEFLARGQSDRTQRFRLVHFAVAKEGPNFATG